MFNQEANPLTEVREEGKKLQQEKIANAFKDFWNWNEAGTSRIYKDHLTKYLFFLVNDFKETADNEKLQQSVEEIRLLWNMFDEME